MTCDFTSLLTVFQSYQDDVWVIMKALCNGTDLCRLPTHVLQSSGFSSNIVKSRAYSNDRGPTGWADVQIESFLSAHFSLDLNHNAYEGRSVS